MATLSKSTIVQTLESIQRKCNEDTMKILGVIKNAKQLPDTITIEQSVELRNQLYRIENEIFSSKASLTRLEGQMFAAEERCSWCGEIGELIRDEGEGSIHQHCLDTLISNREKSDQSAKDYYSKKDNLFKE